MKIPAKKLGQIIEEIVAKPFTSSDSIQDFIDYLKCDNLDELNIQYEKYVDNHIIREEIFFDGKKEQKVRYELTIPIKLSDSSEKEDKNLVVIMMNPSRADQEESDPTANRVIKYAFEKGYKKVIILNSVPFYESYSDNLDQIMCSVSVEDEEYLQNILKKNLCKIKSVVAKPNIDILLGTGNPKSKKIEDCMLEIYHLLEGEKVLRYGMNSSGYYKHPLFVSSAQIEEIEVEVPERLFE